MSARTPPNAWFPKRGDVYLVNLDKQRPAIVISTDALNRHALDVCVVLVTTVEHPEFSLRVRVERSEGGLNRDSWAKCDQVTTLEKTLLVYPPLGKLTDHVLRKIEHRIKLALELL
jgi:mRNA interferase MazF